MPKVKNVLPIIREATVEVRKLSTVQRVSVLGAFAQNIDNDNFRVKDVSILIDTNIHAGDLLGIDIQNDDPFSLTRDEIEDLGFSSQAITLTKKIKKLSSYMFDVWAKSDNTILHWGFAPETIEDWKELRKEAESQTTQITGYDKLSLHKKSDQERISWHNHFDEFMRTLVQDAPDGWYESIINPEDDMFLQTADIERQ